MSKLSKIKSFDDFKANKNIEEKTAKKAIAVKEHSSVITKQRETLQKVNESAFKVGSDYKVKVTIDVPISLVKAYIEKVSQETGKNALDNFSESEIAEQMVQHTLKNLNIDNIPSAMSVGDSPAQQISPEQQIDAALSGASFGDEQELELDIEGGLEGLGSEDIEITDSDLSLDVEDSEDLDLDLDDDDEIEELGEEGQFGDEKEAGEELELETEDEASLGEERSIDNDTETTTDDFSFDKKDESDSESDVEGEEEEEYILDDSATSKRIMDMALQLRGSGLDPRDFDDEQIVDIWNDIFNMGQLPINGIDDTGSIIMPSMF
jgi:hypothetical protein